MSKIQKIILSILSLAFIVLVSQIAKAERTSDKETIIFDQGFEYKIESDGETIGEILNNGGIEIQENDIVFPSLDYKLEGDRYPVKIIIDRAIPVLLIFYDKAEKIFTQKDKVVEVLKAEGINLKDNDLINYNLNTEIFPNIEIKIWQKPRPERRGSPQRAAKPIKFVKTGEIQTGLATWYSYIPGNFCASTTYRKGTKLLVTNLKNGKKVIVTVNDYGPFNGPIIDLERNAFLKLSPLFKGVIRVRVEKIKVL